MYFKGGEDKDFEGIEYDNLKFNSLTYYLIQ
jgi:hypothetical protein